MEEGDDDADEIFLDFNQMNLNVWSLNSAVRKVFFYPYYLFTTSEVNTIILTTYQDEICSFKLHEEVEGAVSLSWN